MDEKKRKEIDEWLRKDKERADAYEASQEEEKEPAKPSWSDRIFDREDKYDIGTLPKKKKYQDGGIITGEVADKAVAAAKALRKRQDDRIREYEESKKPKEGRKSFSKLMKMLEKSHR